MTSTAEHTAHHHHEDAQHADPSVKTALFGEIWKAWPDCSGTELGKVLGDEVATAIAAVGDDSAARLSAAFNATGHKVLHSTTYSGKKVHDTAGNLVVVDPFEWDLYLSAKLGKPRHCKDASGAALRKGILYFEHPASLQSSHAAGYFDLWDGKQTKTVADYWADSKNIWLFELAD